MDIRPYDHKRDFKAVRRTWEEVGWLPNEGARRAIKHFVSAGNGSVGIMDGEAESFVHWTPGRVRYEQADLSLAAVTAVTTSRVARRQGLATKLTAEALASAETQGAHVAMLGMFDQGFYDRLGFGTGTYDHVWTFDPHSLLVEEPYRSPARLGKGDWEAIHGCISGRMRLHGGVALDPPQIMRGEIAFIENPFALGYRDGDAVSHCIVGEASGESGPYRVDFLGYQNHRQLLELLRLIRELGDQVVSVTMAEPPGIQLQDLLDRPYRQRTRTRKSKHETTNNAIAWWQIRILDVETAVAARHWHGAPVAFQLTLQDPLATLVDGPWKGAGGDYVVEVGTESTAEKGSSQNLPRLEASVGAFSRLWFGVRDATSLAVTDRLSGPPELLSLLNEAFSLPSPTVGQFF